MRLTDRDRRLLAFVAEHRFVHAGQVQALLDRSGAAVSARLRALVRAGALGQEPLFERQPSCYWITRRGLGLIDSELPPPRLDAHAYKHDIGVGWLWLAARAGTLGPAQAVLSERRMRSSDAARAHTGLAAAGVLDGGIPVGEPFAIRLGGLGPGGRQRLHYPDLMLVGRDGRRVAFELELTAKSRARRERILAGYAADRRVDAVVYLVERPSVGRAIEASAGRLGLSATVHVRRVRWGRQRLLRAPEPGLRPQADRRAATVRNRPLPAAHARALAAE